jgi:hypothetical protein
MVTEKAFNGKIAWLKKVGSNSVSSVSEIQGAAKDEIVQDTLMGVSSVKNCYSEIEVGKNESFFDKECLVLICKKSNSPTIVNIFVDKQSFLIAGVSSTTKIFTLPSIPRTSNFTFRY